MAPAKILRTLTILALTALTLAPATSLSAAPAAPAAAAAPASIQKVANVVYKTVGSVQIKLDIYVPGGPGLSGPFPALIMIHGGGWADSTKADVASYAQDFAALGFVTYAVDFRESCDPLNPGPGDDPSLCGYLFPTHEEDLRDAIVWIRTNAPSHPEWKTMGDRVGVWGTSSGGNIAGSLATGWNHTGGAEGTPGWDKPDAWVDYAGAMDMVNGGGDPAEPGRIAGYLGCHPYDDPPDCADPDITYKSSPLYNLTTDDPPAFLMGASQDPILPVDQHAVAMYDAMQALSMPSELYVVDGACHAIKCTVVDPTLEQHTADWLHSILGPRAPTVAIQSAPDASTPLGQATFTFTAGPGVSTACALDGGSLVPCISPTTAQNLGVGRHQFLVQGTDATGTGDPSTYYWTVSPRTVSITDTGFNPKSLTSVIRGSLVQWTNNGANPHTVTDASAMGLFDSGPIGPGQTFTQMFIAAGVFSYTSTLDPGSSGEVKVPVGISPTTVQPGQSYVVTWAAQPAPADFVYDVQYKDPNGGSWVNWKTDVTNLNGRVTTNGNTLAGKWLYRARIQRVSTDATSAWSSSSGVTVTAGDVTPPITTITGGPVSPTTDKTATFTYVANEPATFQCAIDGGAFSACQPGGKTYQNLAKGTHNFGARATDVAGNVGVPATWTWYVSKVVTASITDAGFSPATMNPAFGATVRWTNNGTMPHTVTDSSPMALFDSGPIPPGGTFEFFFDGASTYDITSTVDTGMTQKVQVAPTVSPATGTVTTPFTITFAAITPPPTELFDVLVKRPGAGGYQLLFIGQTGTSAVFTPDRGTGTYSFVVQARNLANDTEGLSPKVSILVGG